MRHAWIRIGLGYGVAFLVVGVLFVILSLFTTVDRGWWERANLAKGIVGFGLCAVAGVHVAHRRGLPREAAGAGALAGALAGIAVPLAIYGLAYAGLTHLQQYPFEYFDMRHAGFTDAAAYLRSSGGRATVTQTTIGLVPIVAVWATLQGGLLAWMAAYGWRRWAKRARTFGVAA